MYRESEEEKSKRNALNKTQCARQRWDYFDLSSVTTSQWQDSFSVLPLTWVPTMDESGQTVSEKVK